MKAIQTTYKGYRFRSRLEARWAVFFDAMRIPWEYEPEGYRLPDGRGYLPDFRLPRMGLLLDIKPKPGGFDGMPWIEEGSKEYEFYESVSTLDHPAYGVIYGTPGPTGDYSDLDSYAVCVGYDTPYLFCMCPWCGKLGVEFEGRGSRVCGSTAHGVAYDDRGHNPDHPELLIAFAAARSARFEHGEIPGR